MIKKLPVFWKNFSVVLIGSVLYQALPILILPILTRIVPPNEMGRYFTWYGGVLILTVVMSLRFDMAIFQTDDDDEARNVVRAVAVIGAALLLLFSFIAFVAHELVPDLNLGGLSAELLFALFFASFFLGLNAVLSSLYARDALFKRQAVWKILLGVSVASLQLLFVLFYKEASSLAFALILGSMLVTILMFRDLKINFFALFRGEGRNDALRALKKFKKFALISMPSALINTFAIYLPLFLVGGRLGGEAAASYGLTQRTLSAPLGLVGRSVTAVFREEASRIYRETGACREPYARTFRALAMLGILPFTVLGAFGKEIFSFVFGQHWGEAGLLAQYMAPLFYVRFIASPLSYMFFLVNKQGWDFIWQVCLLVVTGVIFWVSSSLDSAVIFYSASCASLYMVNMFLSYKISSGR